MPTTAHLRRCRPRSIIAYAFSSAIVYAVSHVLLKDMKRVSCEFDIELHVKACSVPTQDCAKCLFASECQTRRWLLHAKTGYGCKICRKGGANSQWAACTIQGALCLKKQNLDRHANSKVHIHCQTKALVLGYVVPDAAMYKRLVSKNFIPIPKFVVLNKLFGPCLEWHSYQDPPKATRRACSPYHPSTLPPTHPHTSTPSHSNSASHQVVLYAWDRVRAGEKVACSQTGKRTYLPQNKKLS